MKGIKKINKFLHLLGRYVSTHQQDFKRFLYTRVIFVKHKTFGHMKFYQRFQLDFIGKIDASENRI